MTETISTPPEPAIPTPSRAASIANFLKEWLPIVSQLSIFVIIGGFVVVHSYLSTITTLFSYNINVTQYVAAGISLIFYIPFVIILLIINSFVPALLLIAVIVLI